MSYEEPGAAESFVFRVRKSIIAQPSIHWYNTYEARFHDIGSSEDLDSLAAGLVEFEAGLLLDIYKIDQVTISTWLPDAHPYNPTSFVTQPYNRPGDRVLGVASASDLRTCLFIKRTVESGRIGRLFLRGYYKRDELVSNGLEWFDPAPLTAEGNISSAVTAGGLTSNFEGAAGNPWLALIGAGQLTRFIQDLVFGGVTQVKMNHKYFDRA